MVFRRILYHGNIYAESGRGREKVVCGRRRRQDSRKTFKRDRKVLRGKNKAIFTPHEDTGDYVIVVNAEKIQVTGKKLDQKHYYSHSDYVGGFKDTTLRDMMKNHPERVIEKAVRGMLPKGALGNTMAKKLFVYAGPEHKHAAQKPEALEI